MLSSEGGGRRRLFSLLNTVYYLYFCSECLFIISLIRYSDADSCKLRNPCKNGATCATSAGQYSCQCPGNYEGKHCDEGISQYCIRCLPGVLRWLIWGSPAAFNNMITATHCEGANNKCKVKTIVQDNGCSFFIHAFA